MSNEKNYNLGQINVDYLNTDYVNLSVEDEPPYVCYTHELPLFTFGDVQHTVNLSLVFYSKRYIEETINGDNYFSL